MKRQRSRNRKPSGNQNNPNRAYESNGPEGTKVRGNAQTIYEKYQQLARDANSSGDRVLAENHLQHAEHYFRLIRQMQPQRPVSEFVQRDPFSNGYDDFDDDVDSESAEGDVAEAAQGDEAQPSFDDNRDGGNRDRYDSRGNGNDRNNGNGHRDRNRNDRDRNDRNGNRDRNDRPNYQDRNQDRSQNREPRTFEPRVNPSNEADAFDADGNRRESRRERYERRRHQRLSDQEQNLNAAPGGQPSNGYIASTEPLGGAPNGNRASQNGAQNGAQSDFTFEAAPAPAAREKPVREKPARPARDSNGASDASHLPAFLSRPATAAPVAEPVDADAKPKRGRPKRKAEEVSAE